MNTEAKFSSKITRNIRIAGRADISAQTWIVSVMNVVTEDLLGCVKRYLREEKQQFVTNGYIYEICVEVGRER